MNNPILLIERPREGVPHKAAEFPDLRNYYYNFAEAVWKVSKGEQFDPETFLTLQTMQERWDFNFIRKKFESMYPIEEVENGYVSMVWRKNPKVFDDLKNIIIRMEIAIAGHYQDEEQMDQGIRDFVDFDLPVYLVEEKLKHEPIGGMTTNH